MQLPSILERIPRLSRGLVLVTGATGSGKSSTLAALIHEINRSRPAHIVTIEDPIEYVHAPLKGRISQREVGSDTRGFADALRSALREDPDVILVGEMRDPETVAVALKAAETGHLVLSTVHTQDAVRTLGRLIAIFPPEEQRLVRLRLADNLAAILSQRLVAKKGGGRLAAMEVVMVTQTVRDCIESPERSDEILEHVQASGDGQSFDRHLVELYLSGQITLETAQQSATRPSDLERELRFGKVSGGSLPAEDQNELEPAVELTSDLRATAGAAPDPAGVEKEKGRDPSPTPSPSDWSSLQISGKISGKIAEKIKKPT
jgi:twitching motility protein PilT